MDRRPIRGADGPAGTLAAWTRPARAPGIDQAAAWDRRLAARRSRLRFSSPRVSRPHEAPESTNLPRPAALDAGLQARAHGRLRPSGPRTARRWRWRRRGPRRPFPAVHGAGIAFVNPCPFTMRKRSGAAPRSRGAGPVGAEINPCAIAVPSPAARGACTVVRADPAPQPTAPRTP